MYPLPKYSYTMTVAADLRTQKEVYQLLYDAEGVIGKYLTPGGPASAPFSSYRNTETDRGSTGEWLEDEMEELLHGIAILHPSAVLEIRGQDENDQSYGFAKRFQGDFFQETKLQTIMPPFQEDRNVLFVDRYKMSTASLDSNKIQILCQEIERDNDIRTFEILAVSPFRDDLRKLMRALIAKDEYGYIANNGIEQDGPDYFRTKESDLSVGFVEYFITEEPVLSSSDVMSMLESAEYAATVHFPGNLKDILTSAIITTAIEEGYGSVDADKVVEAMMADKQFQAMVKTNWWGDKDILEGKVAACVAEDCSAFLSSLLDEQHDYFETVGAVPPFLFPDNLRDVLIDSIYDVGCKHRLPISEPAVAAERCMRNSEFRSAIRLVCCQLSHLDDGTDAYQTAAQICREFAEANMVPQETAEA